MAFNFVVCTLQMKNGFLKLDNDMCSADMHTQYAL